jgi:hypothetical protein
MEAVRRGSVSLAIAVLLVMLGDSTPGLAQGARTRNFIVHARDQALAETVARSAEKFRDDLAIYWLGEPLPPWPTPCPIEVVSGPQLAAQGVTNYNRSPVGNFQMKVIGTPERILDSVLPHEVTHTVLATHFGRPLPRWADEGICTTVEHSAERDKHEVKLREFLSTRRGIAMNQLFLLTEYPSDMLPMYAQGYSVCRFLIQQSGPRRFIEFLEDYMRRPSWTANVQAHYGYDSLAQLQENWLSWVAQGSGPVESFVSARTKAAAIASNADRSGGSTSARELNAAAVSARTSTVGQPGFTELALNGSPAIESRSTASWYEHRREQTALGKLAATAGARPTPAASRIGPPSVTDSGPYSASQPLREEHYGQRAPTASSSTRSTPIYH